jgi:glycine hydroxymethyltransferase
VLDEAGITCNKNMIPYDPEKPMVTSGIRIGSAAMTTRGMKEPEMERIVDGMDRVLSNPDSESIKKEVKAKMLELTSEFPLYPDLENPWA